MADWTDKLGEAARVLRGTRRQRARRADEFHDPRPVVDRCDVCGRRLEAGTTYLVGGKALCEECGEAELRRQRGGKRRGGKDRAPGPRAKVITDFGYVPEVTDAEGNKLDWGHRYLVWAPTGRRDEVIDGGNDLAELQKRYPGLKVIVFPAPRRGGKRRFDPAQLKEGAAEELREHGKTLAKLRAGKLTVKQAAAQTAKDHLKVLPDYYSRLDALEVPKPKRGLKSPRIKLLMKRGKVRVYLVASHLVRKMKDQGDWANGGHSTVFPATIPRNEVWIGDETFGPERKLYILHELLEFWRMNHGMSYDEAHDLSTEAEQKFRCGKMRGIDAAVRDALKKAAGGRKERGQ